MVTSGNLIVLTNPRGGGSMKEIELILEELELIKANDIKTGRTSLNGVLNYCRDINAEEEA